LTQKAPIKPAKDLQPIRREIEGIVFLLLAILVAGSLLSYYPADRLLWNVTGPLGKSRNLFGVVGAHIAGGLLFLIGLSSFWPAVILAVLAILSFKGLPLSSPVLNVISSGVLILTSSGLLSVEFPETPAFIGGKIIPEGLGGLAGLYLAGFTRSLFNHYGALICLLTLFVISFMFCTRLSLGSSLSTLFAWISTLFRKIRILFQKRHERRKRALKTRRALVRPKPAPKVTIVEHAPEVKKKPEQEAFSFMKVPGQFLLPSLDLLDDPPPGRNKEVQRESLEMNARRLEKKLADFGVQGEVVEILPGPVITMYEFKPAPGVKISKVASLSDDLALTLRASSIRIVAPIPGKAAIGIEIPNNQREMVFLKQILSSSAYHESNLKLPIALGKDITGAPVITDLSRMPHLLVAGATGTGKSVSINTMINSLLFKVPPEMVRFLMIDPKRIELSIYQDIPHLLHPVVIKPKEATKALRWAVQEMERRYMLLSDLGVRNIEAYNRKLQKGAKASSSPDTQEPGKKPLPYIILIIDELADLMMASSREVEEAITRLAQMARAAGIHLIIATQRPSVDVLTGIIKANFPTRISFQVSSKVDSRTILDGIGAEHLLGDGDMLFMPPGVGRVIRIHGAFVSEDEIKRVTDFLREQQKPEYDESILSAAQEEAEDEGELERDEKYDQAVDIVLQSGQASISMIQRKLRVGYNRAARMIEVMERDGIVGPSDGVRPRDVYGKNGEL
jgi:S-DNA-T family DNA segregation ATPase FtsK/SpoIIIE